LLFITILAYSALNQGYEKQIKNIPLEILSSVTRELCKDEPIAPSVRNFDSTNQELSSISKDANPKKIDIVGDSIAGNEPSSSNSNLDLSFPLDPSFDMFESLESVPLISPIVDEETPLLVRDEDTLSIRNHLEPTVWYIFNF
jgi:hypothetical protein